MEERQIERHACVDTPCKLLQTLPNSRSLEKSLVMAVRKSIGRQIGVAD